MRVKKSLGKIDPAPSNEDSKSGVPNRDFAALQNDPCGPCCLSKMSQFTKIISFLS
jgi:hypothetical protein